MKRALGRAGLTARELTRYGSELAIMRQTGHKSSAMVRKYIRADRQDRQAAAGKLGL